jgi:NADPH:quinone reductase-like Zn-dependent oxidoreductase
MFSINPLSVVGLCDIVSQRNSSYILLSAAASNVNKMAVQYLSTRLINKTILGMSRSAAYDNELKKLGYDQLFRMDDFDSVKRAFGEGANAAFLDCVGGNFAGQAFNVLPKGSIMVNYGRLSKENLGSIDLAELYFKDKSIRGFWLNTYLTSIGKQQLEQAKSSIV